MKLYSYIDFSVICLFNLFLSFQLVTVTGRPFRSNRNFTQGKQKNIFYKNLINYLCRIHFLIDLILFPLIDFTGINIIFPEDNYRHDSLEVSLRIRGVPKCANGVKLCENFNPYPTKKIQRILEKSPIYSDFWTKDEEVLEFGERDGEDEKFVCSAIQRTIFPNVGVTKNNKWKYIVNQPEGYFKQGITIETCRT